MGEQEKEQIEKEEAPKTTEPIEVAPETEEQTVTADAPEQNEDQLERIKDATEKLWGNTRHAWSTATFRATQYKRLVQKKIDVAALHKKIEAAHSELGKLIDDQREAGKKNILATAPVKALLQRLDELKVSAAELEAEIEALKNEEPPPEESEKH